MSTQERSVTRPDLPFHDVLDYLIRKWRGPSTVYHAYEIVTAIGQLGLRELQGKLAQLASDNVLRPRWTLEAPHGALHISDDELNRVLASNAYRQPGTGIVIDRAALKLCLSYEAGPALNQLMMFAEGPAYAGPSAA